MKLITWNVQWFCGLDDVVSVERVVDEARAMTDFDVLCLQEVAVNYPKLGGNAGFDQVARLQQLLPGFELCFGAAVDEFGRAGQRQRFGNLVATRLPLLQQQHTPLPYPAEGGVRSMPRMCTSATVRAPFGPVRIMTTHLEFYSRIQRMAQAQALVALHAQGCRQAAHPPMDDETGGPFQNKAHTHSAILCGDFNLETTDPEYALLQAAAEPNCTGLVDAWPVTNGEVPHPSTFRLHDKRYGPVPVSCDFVFVSEDLRGRLQRMECNLHTRASDHQPVLLELASD
ncbi:MAG: endonuclease/exonuclease/phosphatase family protein [Rhodoferax sp.]|nr:endonuclease/exonuclease/phosphatase family protein [Rhodoferax sp.]